MQSNNPVFRRSEEFSRANPYGHATYEGNGAAYQGFGNAPQPGYQGYGQTPQAYAEPGIQRDAGRMTIDTVVQSTAITLGVVIIAAAATWLLTPAITDEQAAGTLGLITMVGAGAAFVLSLVNSFKRVISPALVLAFAAAEGIALGALSKFYDTLDQVGGSYQHIVLQAVIGTFAAFGGTLAVYKFFDIKVGQKFRTMVMAAMWGMVGLGVLELVLGLFGGGLGLFDNGALGLLFAAAGLVLGVFMLVLDFDFVEQGVRNGLPQRESWRASFALTVSLVWIYTNLLRILAILSDN